MNTFDTEQKKYGYWLANISGLGNIRIARMLLTCDSPKEIYDLKLEQLLQLPGVDGKLAKKIYDSKKFWDLDQEIEKLEARGIHFVYTQMEDYPEKLRYIYQPPFGLYYKGALPNPQIQTASIVGARMCSDYGKHMAYELGKTLSAFGIQIVSGMAAGVDYHAQKGALDQNHPSFAVLGCGVEVCYPDSSYGIFRKLPQCGGLISEYVPEQQPFPGLFPQRNRIISGLSDLVIVVEAKVRSGSLITADQALEQGKDVYAVPGRCTDSLSYGCNHLIRQGAGMILSTQDLCAELQLISEKEIKKNGKNILTLEKEEQLVYSCLDLCPKIIDDIMKDTGLELRALLRALDALEEKCLIRESFQNYYIRNIT